MVASRPEVIPEVWSLLSHTRFFCRSYFLRKQRWPAIRDTRTTYRVAFMTLNSTGVSAAADAGEGTAVHFGHTHQHRPVIEMRQHELQQGVHCGSVPAYAVGLSEPTTRSSYIHAASMGGVWLLLALMLGVLAPPACRKQVVMERWSTRRTSRLGRSRIFALLPVLVTSMQIAAATAEHNGNSNTVEPSRGRSLPGSEGDRTSPPAWQHQHSPGVRFIQRTDTSPVGGPQSYSGELMSHNAATTALDLNQQAKAVETDAAAIVAKMPSMGHSEEGVDETVKERLREYYPAEIDARATKLHDNLDTLAASLVEERTANISTSVFHDPEARRRLSRRRLSPCSVIFYTATGCKDSWEFFELNDDQYSVNFRVQHQSTYSSFKTWQPDCKFTIYANDDHTGTSCTIHASSMPCLDCCLSWADAHCHDMARSARLFRHQHGPHSHTPHGHSPHGHSPHSHSPHSHCPMAGACNKGESHSASDCPAGSQEAAQCFHGQPWSTGKCMSCKSYDQGTYKDWDPSHPNWQCSDFGDCIAKSAFNCPYCAQCPAGKWRSGCGGLKLHAVDTSDTRGDPGSCLSCPLHTFKDSADSYVGRDLKPCTPCSNLECPPGKKQVTAPGQMSCSPDSDDITCQDCDQGTYKPTTSAGRACAACGACLAGQYRSGCGALRLHSDTSTDKTSAGSCVTCPLGKYKSMVRDRAWAHTRARAGARTHARTLAHTAHTHGRHSLVFTLMCTRSQGGTASTSCTTCQTCPAGQRIMNCGGLNGDNGRTDSGTCTNCEAGKYKPRQGWRLQGGVQVEGDCLDCPAGKYSGPGATSCTRTLHTMLPDALALRLALSSCPYALPHALRPCL